MLAATAINPAELSDAELLIRIRAGDLDAYEGIMRHHNQRLFRLARSIVSDDSEAMDVVQEAFVSAYQQLATLKSANALSTWLARITRNAALMRLRKSRRYQYMDEPEFENVLSLAGTQRLQDEPELNLTTAQLRQLLEDSIDALPDAFRAVFMLRAIEHCSVESTADILEIEKGTVKTRFHRARLLLQEKLLQYFEEAGVSVHEFAGPRCDAIVHSVLEVLRAAPPDDARSDAKV